jgi:hypothetical protein
MRSGEESWRGGTLGRAAIAAVALWATIWTPAGRAEIIAPQHRPPQVDDGWQAGVCYSDRPTCSVATPEQFFEQASGHPQVSFTQFIVEDKPLKIGGLEVGRIPVGNLRTVRVDLPAGLSVNPQATPERCDLAAVGHPGFCPAGSKVGTSEVTVTNPLTGLSVTLPKVRLYNLAPRPGEPARFGSTILGNDVFLDAGVEWAGDYHEFFTIHLAKHELGGISGLEVARVRKNRLDFEGRAGNGTFITLPSTCNDHESPPYEHLYSTYLRADSYEEEDSGFPAGSPFIESELASHANPRECGSIPFDPSVGVAPGTGRTDSPAGLSLDVRVPFEVPSAEEVAAPRTSQASSDVRRAEVTLPAGMGLNPSAASGGLRTCGDAQFGLGSRSESNGCPAASKIGTVSIDTPPLPDGSLAGDVYAGRQLSRDPLSGREYRIFVEAASRRYGVFVRLEGKVAADPLTGRLTATFEGREVDGLGGTHQPTGLPQLPFSTFTLDFDGGAHAVLTSPTTCGPSRTTTELVPWSGNAGAHPSTEFTLASSPGGGACASSGRKRPFAPRFAARTANPRGGAYSPLSLDVVRADGEQELKGVEVDLPPGVTAKLAGLTYCPDAALAAAAGSGGAEEAASPSCPVSSRIGGADIVSGSGPAPVHISGSVFLAGPYRGAPLSLAVVTPATAGPFDLGTVVLRMALFVQPETAQVHAVSDPIPHVYGGALLDVRSISIRADRPGFSLNPTSCAPTEAAASLRGGADDPSDLAALSSRATTSFFQVHGCDALGFRPKLSMRLYGGRRRAKHPKLRAVLVARGGDANIDRAAVTLPRGLILDQANLAKVCTRVQFAAGACPRESRYGWAQAFTPLLDKPLEGPVYVRSSEHELPDLVSDLHGQVHIVLDGRTDSVQGRIRSTFDSTPDVPVSKFILTLRGGRKGLLVNSRNLCRRRRAGGKHGSGGARSSALHRVRRRPGLRAIARFGAWNGKKRNLKPRLRLPCGKKRRHGRR